MNEQPFRVEEASIAGIQAAIIAGRTTCVDIVQQYLARVRAFNGVATMLVTEDGADVPAAPGIVRGGMPVRFPTATVPAASLFPDLADYRGAPLEYGRMEPTASEPHVSQQYGMVTGMCDGNQLNALSTLNIRGERSVTCWGEFDRHPDEGPLPPDAPVVCEILRHRPDALEQAAAMDTAYGSEPDLERFPLYGVVVSMKDTFDAQDMRSTGSADAQYDVDFPARDHILVERLREKGAIVFAKDICTEYNGRAGDPGGKHLPEQVLPSVLGLQRSSWAGSPVNPYDTSRAPSYGSSSGSAVAVNASLVTVSIGEETRASCRGPANHNALALILPHKGALGFDGGAIGADVYMDRAGIIGRSLADCAKVLDALSADEGGTYDPRDVFTTVPQRHPQKPTALSSVSTGASAGSLAGTRIGIIRESMLRPGPKAFEPITQAAAEEMRAVLRDRLGAELVESVDPRWRPEIDLEHMTTSFRDALARLVPIFMPDLLFRLDATGEPVFPEFASMIVPTEFAPDVIHGGGTLLPIDYLVAMAEGELPPPANLDIATVQQQVLAPTFRFHMTQYLARRAADWKAHGVTESLDNFTRLNERSKFWGDDQRAAFKNWEAITDPRNPLRGRQGVNERIMLRELLRRVDMMVLIENRLDVLVRLHTPVPPARIGGATHPDAMGMLVNELMVNESMYGPNAGLMEVLVPAGFVNLAYDPLFKLSEERTHYDVVASDEPTEIPAPGLPFSFVFRGAPESEDVLLRVAAAYESASRRRIPPPRFIKVP
jgi:Asp-tRNA(Asn)/Glu-tRNA(Gln) amidotransferase A subunit family amidase